MSLREKVFTIRNNMSALKFIGAIGIIGSLTYLPMEYCGGGSPCLFFGWDWIWSKPKLFEQISILRTLLQVAVAITFFVFLLLIGRSKSSNSELRLNSANTQETDIPAPTLSVKDSLISAVKKWKCFDGRASKAEFLIIFPILLALIYSAKFIFFSSMTEHHNALTFAIYITVSVIALCTLFSVTVRRLHDIHRSVFWSLLWVTTIGAPMLIWLLLENGTTLEKKGKWTYVIESALVAAIFWVLIFLLNQK